MIRMITTATEYTGSLDELLIGIACSLVYITMISVWLPNELNQGQTTGLLNFKNGGQRKKIVYIYFHFFVFV